MKNVKYSILMLLLVPMMSVAQQYKDHEVGGRGGYGSGRPRKMQEVGSALTVFAPSGERFLLVINGVAQNNYAESKVRVEGLPVVENDLQIIFENSSIRPIRRRIAFNDPIDMKAINMVLKVDFDNDGDVKLKLVKIQPLEREYRSEYGEYNMHYGKDQPRVVQQQVVMATPPPPPPPAGPVAVDPRTFEDIRKAIASNSWDDSKLSTAKTIANTNFFTTDQVVVLCKLFQWDESKLDFAKYVFKRTVDNNNYFKVNSVFQWEDQRKELNDYVNKNR
jgi:hypothetical protein